MYIWKWMNEIYHTHTYIYIIYKVRICWGFLISKRREWMNGLSAYIDRPPSADSFRRDLDTWELRDGTPHSISTFEAICQRHPVFIWCTQWKIHNSIIFSAYLWLKFYFLSYHKLRIIIYQIFYITHKMNTREGIYNCPHFVQ